MRWPPRRSPRCRSGMAWHGMADCVDSFHTAILSALSATSTSSRRTSALDLTALCCSAPTLRGQRQIFAAQTGATPHSTRGAHRTYGADISVLSDFTSAVPFEQGPAVVYQDSPYSSLHRSNLLCNTERSATLCSVATGSSSMQQTRPTSSSLAA